MFGIDDMAIAGLAAGAISSAGQIYANNKNIQFASKNNNSQIGLANTAHQREVRDLLAAGLNPVLSASGSGSPVPQLGSPDIGNPGQGLSDGIHSASKVLSDEYKAQVANLKSNTANTKVNTTAVRLANDKTAESMRTFRLDQAFDLIEKAARLEAFTGKSYDTVNALIDWDDSSARNAYRDLVQYFRNDVENKRYLNSVQRSVIRDGADVVGSPKVNVRKTTIKKGR